MGGKKSQTKGRRAEKELSKILRGYGYDVEVGRPLSFGKEPDLIGLDGVHIECKRAEQLRLSEWLAQAAADAEKFRDGLPAVFHRGSREAWRVSMALTDWLELYRSYRPPPGSNYKE